MISRKLEEYINLSQKKVEEHLDRILAEKFPEIIYQSMRYSVFAGGKRLRPLLCLLSYQMVSKDQEIDQKILDIASAIELIHTYSLIHDDLPAMDNDVLRRGKPTNHVVFGRSDSYFGRGCTFKFSSRGLY
ncbi:polyprenyl synthetase family protein [Caldicellulosiruptor danielii]|uniref:Polyprenyl synthetase family protein n=1 Tax=Anaerocellum danielii TaxID=1387557 RepID=A0ABZ0U228_9FIRM|nr:polyprenyl synthetase family protein [Caldicellulosiruptor danielii]WPX09730.1 polyprenyl synthetase family protein [Caldicellulosiruptor danielii]